jgi:hypothetical protein
LINDLLPSISPSRLQRYQSAAGDPLETIVNYLWNMALAESLYCSLSAVEVALRNALHDTLTRHFGTPTWYDRQGLLERRQVDEVSAAKQRIRGYGKAVTPDRVVSELTFGFWVTILSRPYDARLWQGQNAAPLKHAFPRVPRRQRQRRIIHQHYNAIRESRNRVFHHEPLFDDRLLRQRHGQVYRGIRWLNPTMADCFELFDRFDDVVRNGRAQIEGKIKAHLGIP